MLYKQENITLVDEVRKTGRGNRVWIEILKFLAVLTPINLIMVFAGEAIKAALFQKSVINEEISMIIQLYECALGIGLVVLYCCCIEKRTFMSMGFMKRHVCKQYIKGACVGAMLISALVWMGVLFNTFIFNGFNVNLDKKSIFLFLGGFLLQGFYEELVFRGFFMISIIRKNTIFVAVMVNSILFGLTHGFNNGFQVLALLNLILFGIFESIYLLKTGNIWVIVSYCIVDRSKLIDAKVHRIAAIGVFPDRQTGAHVIGVAADEGICRTASIFHTEALRHHAKLRCLHFNL